MGAPLVRQVGAVLEVLHDAEGGVPDGLAVGHPGLPELAQLAAVFHGDLGEAVGVLDLGVGDVAGDAALEPVRAVIDHDVRGQVVVLDVLAQAALDLRSGEGGDLGLDDLYRLGVGRVALVAGAWRTQYAGCVAVARRVGQQPQVAPSGALVPGDLFPGLGADRLGEDPVAVEPVAGGNDERGRESHGAVVCLQPDQGVLAGGVATLLADVQVKPDRLDELHVVLPAAHHVGELAAVIERLGFVLDLVIRGHGVVDVLVRVLPVPLEQLGSCLVGVRRDRVDGLIFAPFALGLPDARDVDEAAARKDRFQE